MSGSANSQVNKMLVDKILVNEMSVDELPVDEMLVQRYVRSTNCQSMKCWVNDLSGPRIVRRRIVSQRNVGSAKCLVNEMSGSTKNRSQPNILVSELPHPRLFQGVAKLIEMTNFDSVIFFKMKFFEISFRFRKILIFFDRFLIEKDRNKFRSF